MEGSCARLEGAKAKPKAKADSFRFVCYKVPFKQRKLRRTKVNSKQLAQLFKEKLQLEEVLIKSQFKQPGTMNANAKELAEKLQKLQLEEEVNLSKSFEFGQQLNGTFDERKASSAGNLEGNSGAYKRKPELVIVEGPMDHRMTQYCSALLKKLMKRRAASVFNKSLDPVALNIPDYFSIIKKPMDLGTIETKLANGAYRRVEEFPADVRRTYLNALKYYPPSNDVHKKAKKMGKYFETLWRKNGIKRIPKFVKVVKCVKVPLSARPEEFGFAAVDGIKMKEVAFEILNQVFRSLRPKPNLKPPSAAMSS